jgi:hypothetical protein
MHLAIEIAPATTDISQGAQMDVAWARQYAYVPTNV